MTRRHRLAAAAAAVGTAVATLLVAPGAASAPPPPTAPPLAAAPVATQATGANGLLIPVDEVLEDGSTLRGVLTIDRLRQRDGQLIAIGHLNGRVTSEDSPSRRVSQPFRTTVDVLTAPVAAADGLAPQQVAGCEVLQLDLGPIDLDLLGLVVDLSPVELDITAVPGAGNLLGNLLCAVVGLLDPGSGLDAGLVNRLLQGVLRLLNQLLGGVAL